MKKLAVLLTAALLATATCALADWDVKFRVGVRTDLGLSRGELARKVWADAATKARELGFRTDRKFIFDEDVEHDRSTADEIAYEIEMGEIKNGGDDADLELRVRCRRSDNAVVSAALVWEADRDAKRHASLRDALAAQADLFLPGK